MDKDGKVVMKIGLEEKWLYLVLVDPTLALFLDTAGANSSKIDYGNK